MRIILTLLFSLFVSNAIAAPVNVVVQGDSISSQVKGGHTWQAWPYQLGTTVANLAVAATGFDRGGANSIMSLGGKADSYRTPTNKLLVFGGSNDIATDGDTAQRVFDLWKVYYATRLSKGWQPSQIWFITMLPRSGGLGQCITPAWVETERQRYINMVVDDAAINGYHVIRLDQNTTIGEAGDEKNRTYYNSDLTHPTLAGVNIITSTVKSALGL